MSTVCELFFCPKFPNIPEKFGRRKRVAIPKRFALQANTKIVKYFMFYTMFNRITFLKEGVNLVIIWGFPHFAFSKKNLWTLIVLHNEEV